MKPRSVYLPLILFVSSCSSSVQPKTHVVAATEFLSVARMQAVECVVLKNMFDVQTYTQEDYADLELDVKEKAEECGKVIHSHIDRIEGLVYLRFDSPQSAQKMINLINGRFYAGRQVLAEFVAPTVYTIKFPNSQQAAQAAATQAFLSAN